MTENVNTNRINDHRAPAYWKGFCEFENSQFCGFSEDGYYHGYSVCDNCPYIQREEEETAN